MGGRSKSGASKSPPGQRQLRVGERLRHVLADILRQGQLRDPVLSDAHLVTVTTVDIGPDLQHATAYVMPLGGHNADEIVKALNRASGYFRSEMAAQLELRYTPKVSFRIDNTFDEADHIDRLLRQEAVRRDVEKAEAEQEEQETSDDDQD